MDSLAAVWCPQVIGLILFRDGRKGQHIPQLVFLNVSNKIVGMEALHDDDDRSRLLAVQATAHSIIMPLIHRPTTRFREGFVRL